MNRREIFKTIATGTVLISIGGVSIVACTDDNYKSEFFSRYSYDFLSELSESILPDSNESPGAKLAGVASFLDRYIPICKSRDSQSDIKNTIQKLGKLTENKFGTPFQKLSIKDKTEQMHIFENTGDKDYRELKSLILFAYFSSIEGMTKALSYVAVPGKYEGDVLYENAQKSWAL